MRDKIWSNLIRTKYQALYMSNFNAKVRSFDRAVNILLAITSSGSIGGWLFWQEYPIIWASILGTSQLINIVLPYLPYLKNKEQLAETYIFYETLHLDYERLWVEVEAVENESSLTDKYFQLKDKELQILDKLKSIKINNYNKIEALTRQEWAEYLRSNYNVIIQK